MSRVRRAAPSEREGERGLSTLGIVISIGAGIIISGIILALVLGAMRSSTQAASFQQQQSSILNAMNQISREVTNADAIVKADEDELIIQTNRNGVCMGFRYAFADYADDEGNTTNPRMADTPETDRYGDVLLVQQVSFDSECSPGLVGETNQDEDGAAAFWPHLPTFDESGFASGRMGDAPSSVVETRISSDLLVTRVKQPSGTRPGMFTYIDKDGADISASRDLSTDPLVASDNSARAISRVDMLINAYTTSDGYVTLTTSAVPRDSLSNPGQLTEVAPPLCPAFSLDVTGDRADLEWTPVDGAIRYRVIRTVGSTASTVATIDPATGATSGLSPRWPGAGHGVDPHWSEDIGDLVGNITYVVTVETASGISSACAPKLISRQMSAPTDATISVEPGPAPIGTGQHDRVGGSWRSGDNGSSPARSTTQPSTRPSYVIRWGQGAGQSTPITGATGYHVQMIEINPATGAEIGDQWVNAPGEGALGTDPSKPYLTVSTAPDGGPLWGREFKFRIQVLSNTGNSPWAIIETNGAGSHAANTTGRNPARRGFLAHSAAPTLSVRHVSDGVNEVTWGRDTSLSSSNRRDPIQYQVQSKQRWNGGQGSWADLWTVSEAAATTRNHTGRPAGEWTDYRVRQCNLAPAPLESGRSCGPWSQAYSSLQRPGDASQGWSEGPPVDAERAYDRANNVLWGRSVQSGYGRQIVNNWDVQFKQTSDSNSWRGLWSGLGSGTTTRNHTVRDEVLMGDYNRYRVRGTNVAGSGRVVGGGTSPWSGQTDKTWQRPIAPVCENTDSDRWNSVRIRGVVNNTPGGAGYVNPTSVNKDKQVRLWGGSTNRSQSNALTGADNTRWTDTPGGVEIAPRQHSDSRYRAGARFRNDGGWSDWGSCDVRTANAPRPSTPSLSSSKGSPTSATWSWNSPANANFYELRNANGGALWHSGTNRSYSTSIGYGNNMCGQVRAAHSQRLGERWGVWSSYSSNSCQLFRPPTPSSCSAGGATTNSLYVTVGGVPSGVNAQVYGGGQNWRAPGTFSGLAPNTTYVFHARSIVNGVTSEGTRTCYGTTLNPAPTRPSNPWVSRTDQGANISWGISAWATYYEYRISAYNPAVGSYVLRGSGTMQSVGNPPLPTVSSPTIRVGSSTPESWDEPYPSVRGQVRAVGPGGVSAWVTAYSAW